MKDCVRAYFALSFCFRVRDTPTKLHAKFVAWEEKVGLNRTHHIVVNFGTAVDKDVDLLNMIGNQPTAIFLLH